MKHVWKVDYYGKQPNGDVPRRQYSRLFSSRKKATECLLAQGLVPFEHERKLRIKTFLDSERIVYLEKEVVE